MPFDIILTQNAPYVINAAEAPAHYTEHKAIASAIEEMKRCGCEVRIARNVELRVIPKSSTALITWSPPTENTDGSPIGGAITGYEVLHIGGDDQKTYVTPTTNYELKVKPGSHTFKIRTLTEYGPSVYQSVFLIVD